MTTGGLISLPVSLGEAFDKLSILQIKLKYITNATKVEEIKKEQEMLLRGLQSYTDKIKYFYHLLVQCNESIWHLCDALRDTKSGSKEVQAASEQGIKYAQNCIAIIEANDARFRIKEKINNALRSTLKEVKSYSSNGTTLLIHNLQHFLRSVGFIRKQSTLYDTVQVMVPLELEETIAAFLSDDRSISVRAGDMQKDSKEDIDNKNYSDWWHCGVVQKESQSTVGIFSTVGDSDEKGAVTAAGDDLSYLNIMQQAQELHLNDGLLYACLPYLKIKAQHKYWYGKDIPQGWSTPPACKIIHPNLGLGDLLITRALVTGKSKWHLDEQLIQKYRTHNTEYKSLVSKVLTDLKVDFQWIQSLPTGVKYDEVSSLCTRQFKPKVVRDLLHGVADLKEEGYIVFHTKSRLDEQRAKLDMTILNKFFQTYTTNKTIVLLGERKIDDNYENKYHQVLSLYPALQALKVNNKVIDRTVENIQAASSYELLQRDIAIIREAEFNVNFGYGGNFVLSTLLGKRSFNFVADLQHAYFSLLKREGLYSVLEDLLSDVRKTSSVDTYKPRGEQGLIQRWTAINSKEAHVLKSYLPHCLICGCESKSSGSFKEIRANDMFHAGELLRYICPQCGVTFGPRKVLYLDDAELERDYRDLYSYYKEGNTEPMEVELLTMLNMNKSEKYLLYGCRQDNVVKQFRLQGYQVYGFDPFSDSASEFLISKYSQLRQHTFAGIASNNLLEHLKDPVKEMKFMTDLLAPRGQMIHATPCLDYAVEITHYHLFFFTGRSIDEICNKVGLSCSVHKNKTLGGIATSYVIFKKRNNKFYGQWDPPVDKVLLEHFFPNHYGLTAIECGAFDGLTENCTKYFEENYDWKTINVEPVPALYAKLCANRSKSINLNYALSDCEGTVEFKQMIHPVHGENFGNGSIKHSTQHMEELMKTPGMGSQILTVQRKRYSTLIKEQKLSKVDLMVLDVEGHETEVLRDLLTTAVKPQVLVVEFPHITLDILKSMLQEYYTFNMISHNNAFFTLKNQKKNVPTWSDLDEKDFSKTFLSEKTIGKIITVDKFLYFSCPTCLGGVQVEKQHVACGIFRHAIYATNGTLVAPHMSKADCEMLVAQGQARGCTGPFRLDTNNLTVSRCDYI